MTRKTPPPQWPKPKRPIKAADGVTVSSPVDDDEQTTPDNDELDQEGIGDSAPAQPNPVGGGDTLAQGLAQAQSYPTPPQDDTMGPSQAQPTPIARAKTHVQDVGDMPQYQKPSLWRQIAAAGLGGVAGYLNTTAGRPGGIARPIDPTAGVQGLMGMPQWQRQVSAWGQRVKLAEYQDTQDEKAREADMRDKEAMARTQYLTSQAGYMNEQRGATADLRRRQAQASQDASDQKFMGTHQFSMPNWQTPINLNPIESQQGSPIAQALPSPTPGENDFVGPTTPDIIQNARAAQSMPLRSGMPQLPVNLQTAPQSLTPNGLTPVPMTPRIAQGMPQGTQAYAANLPEQAAQTAQGRLLPVPPDLQQYLGGATQATSAELVAAARAANAPDPKAQNVTIPMLQMRASGATTGNPQVDAMSAQQAHAALFAAPSGVTVNNQLPNLTAPQQQAADMPIGPDRVKAVIGSIPNKMMQIRVQSLLDGDAQISPAMLSPRKGMDNSWAQASDYAMLADPSWNQNKFHLLQGMAIGYNPDKPVGKNLVSLNTLSQHMDEFFQAMMALKNGNTQSLNLIGNYLGKQFGQADYSNAELAKTAVDAELATALKGSATDTEIKQWSNGLSANMSPAQQAGAKQKLAEIMYKRLDNQLAPYVSTFHKMPATGPTPATLQFLQNAGLDTSKLGTGQGTGMSQIQAPQGGASQGKILVKITDPALAKQVGQSVGTTVQIRADQFDKNTMQKAQ